jgi:hypothetical protein
MSWTCPECNRTFKNTNQSHSCVKKSLDAHFIRKEPQVRATYDALESRLKAIFDFQISPVINAIMFASESTFLAIKPKKSWIDLEFVLDREANEFPIHKTAKVSHTRYAHFIRIQEPKDVDDQLIDWIKNAFQLISKNS